jgi:hypothetical protein
VSHLGVAHRAIILPSPSPECHRTRVALSSRSPFGELACRLDSFLLLESWHTPNPLPSLQNHFEARSHLAISYRHRATLGPLVSCLIPPPPSFGASWSSKPCWVHSEGKGGERATTILRFQGGSPCLCRLRTALFWSQ